MEKQAQKVGKPVQGHTGLRHGRASGLGSLTSIFWLFTSCPQWTSRLPCPPVSLWGLLPVPARFS